MPTADRSRAQLKERVDYWAARLRTQPRVVRVQHMTTKWGSCSVKGVVTLALDLAKQPAGFQNFVIAHELLHLRVPNHGRLFRALMTAHVPDWRVHEERRRVRVRT
ncbi:M48 family metallopeptidase [Gemmatimonas sp.]|uniref:M48 metallopeptidase family protein n=1 Tax=Gemmatimonas sp. TaxID=1962908 RepID=UPI00286CE95F|nr:M48 family metallopeptidase [Gemmatimonas sp.]